MNHFFRRQSVFAYVSVLAFQLCSCSRLPGVEKLFEAVRWMFYGDRETESLYIHKFRVHCIMQTLPSFRLELVARFSSEMAASNFLWALFRLSQSPLCHSDEFSFLL